MPPTLGVALGLGLRAVVREAWLVVVGVVVAFARRVAPWPAWALAAAVLWRAALAAGAERPLDLGAPVEGALAAATAPRFVAAVAGLWLAGTAVGAALRVAFLAGALPTLGGALADAPPGPRFALGLATGTPRVLAAAALGLALDLAGGGFGAVLALAALRITVTVAGGHGSVLLAAAVAGALTLALAVPVALSAIADAAVARAAILAEGPGAAFAASAARFLARPGTFVLAVLGFGAVGTLAPTAIEAFGGTLTGFAGDAAPVVLAGPELMLGLLALLVAAVLDLWRLGTVAVLACGEERGR